MVLRRRDTWQRFTEAFLRVGRQTMRLCGLDRSMLASSERLRDSGSGFYFYGILDPAPNFHQNTCTDMYYRPDTLIFAV